MNVKNLKNWLLTGNKDGNLMEKCRVCGSEVLPKEAVYDKNGLLCRDCDHGLKSDLRDKFRE